MIGIELMLLLCIFFYVDADKGEVGLSNNSTSLLKGTAALIVFIHHIAGVTDGGILNKMNFPSVAVFFLAAGYGLMYGVIHKKNYVRKILKQKIPLLMAWCLFSALCALAFNIFIGESITVKEVLLCFTGNRILNWFFTSLIIHYLFFALAVYVSKNHFDRIFLFSLVFTIIYMIICRLVIQKTSWYASSLAFPTGIYLAYELNLQRKEYLFKGYVTLLSILFIVSFMGGFLAGEGLAIRLARLVFQLMSSEFFAILCLLICIGLKSQSGFLSWCGKNSAAILFMQNISLYALRNNLIWIESEYFFTLGTIIIELLLVYLSEPIYDKIKYTLQRWI